MLVQLDKIDGVASAMTNRSGTLIRIRMADPSKAEKVTERFAAIMKKRGRKPKPVSGEAAAEAIRDEEWRDARSVGELSEIEFRTVFARRVRQFIESASLDEKTSSNLLEVSEQVLAESPSRSEGYERSKFWRNLADRMLEKSAGILTSDQLEELKKRLIARIRG